MRQVNGLAAALLVLLCIIALFWFLGTHPLMDKTHNASEETVILGGTPVRVSVVSTEAARERGLSGRTGLAQDTGMLFFFATPGRYGFWMKDMLFPIDIVWLNEEGTIVFLKESVAPETYPEIFTPESDASSVIELPAGFLKAHGIGKGDTVSYE